jgi:predicted Zn-dependent protease
MQKALLSFMLFLSLIKSVSADLDLSMPDMNLPEMGDPSRNILSYTQEQALGKKLYRQLRRRQAVIEDPELSGWIRALGNRLVASASGSQGSFYFLIIDKPSVNAFAMPGGVIAVHTGLILNADSESELAAVLSHEIAHVSQRHIARMFAKNKNSAWQTGLGVLAGAAAAREDPALGQAVMTAALAA